MAWAQSSKLNRYKGYLKFMFQKFEPKCYFCGMELDWKDFYPSKFKRKQLDSFSIHHVNGNRKDNRIENLEFVHRQCHLGMHRQLEKMIKKYLNNEFVIKDIFYQTMSMINKVVNNEDIENLINRKIKERRSKK